ncbi:hypothetical protein H1W37_06365 [Stappia taiwanensis]|uniref:Uncharacterized protein n=1 Tax=Stappia taiwanensis TaxID=992267 RepID=A0A838XL81_9HYPH|nr:hypothetical protein [Stappia taiwanensis]MBA4611265.1 hypothetical protein [Stappia taiwanensis]
MGCGLGLCLNFGLTLDRRGTGRQPTLTARLGSACSLCGSRSEGLVAIGQRASTARTASSNSPAPGDSGLALRHALMRLRGSERRFGGRGLPRAQTMDDGATGPNIRMRGHHALASRSRRRFALRPSCVRCKQGAREPGRRCLCLGLGLGLARAVRRIGRQDHALARTRAIALNLGRGSARHHLSGKQPWNLCGSSSGLRLRDRRAAQKLR